jgi:ABC-type Na+ efflux pump permease subunit
LADPRLAIARRELQVLGAEKTIVLALLIQLFIAAFSSFLVVGLVSLYDPGSVDGYQIEVAVTGDAAEDLLAAVDDQAGIDPVRYSDPARARAAFDARQVDAVLDARTVEGRVRVDAVAPDENIRTTVVVVQIRDALREFERAERGERAASLDATPLALPREAHASPYYGFTYTVLVPLLVFLPVFISGSIAVDSVTEEFERGTLELLRVAPVSMVDIVDGKLLAAAGIAPVQAALWLVLLEVNGTHIGRPGVLLALAAGLAVFVVALGMVVALLAPDRRAAQFLYSVGVLVLFGASALLPGSPATVAARLAIDSAGPGDVAVVGGYVVLAAAGYAGVRALLPRISVS